VKNINNNEYIFLTRKYTKKYVELNSNSIDNPTIMELDNEIQTCKLEDIFSHENLSKFVKALTYREKLVLSLYYVECKNDEKTDILFMTRSAVNRKRNRALEPLEKIYKKEDVVN
jgi:DNA-directed RNA polymerase specialized sigma subunit